MPFYMEDKEFSDAYEGWVNAQSDEERKRYIATMFDNAYQRNGANKVIAAWDTKNLMGLTESKLSQFDVSDGIGDFTVFKNGNIANAANSAVAAMAQSVMDGSAFNGAYRIVEESELTAEEQRIFDDFKAQHPIRTYDNVEKAQGTFKIYQLPGGEKYHGIRFEGMEQLKKDGVQLNKVDYVVVPVAGSLFFV